MTTHHIEIQVDDDGAVTVLHQKFPDSARVLAVALRQLADAIDGDDDD